MNTEPPNPTDLHGAYDAAQAVCARALAENPLLQSAAGLCRDIAHRFRRPAVMVGGAVRDILIGNPVADVDIATAVGIEEIAGGYRDSFGIGQSQRFGVTMVRWGEHQFEVAQFRKDGSYGDSRRPDSVSAATSFAEDAARRDFTINAMALTPDGTLLDHYGGLADLRARVVRTVGAPEERFREDGLRVLRAARFASRLGFDLDPATLRAMQQLTDVVLKVSGERIREEFTKSATSGRTLARFVELLDAAGVLAKVLPEVKALQGLRHSPVHHPEGGVWEHVLAALKASRTADPIANLAILFHDLGKATTGAEKDGQPTYLGHEAAGIPIFADITTRLRFSGEEREAIELAIHSHMLGHHFDQLSEKTVLKLRQHPHWETLLATFHADEAARGHLFQPEQFERKMARAEELIAKLGAKREFDVKMRRLINGTMIQSLLPGVDGKEIGRIKSAVQDEILARHFAISAVDVEALVLKMGRTEGSQM
ncbi:MAG: CCA tRNA nucleotidyltransferase [Limisphaerales bacterium]